MILHSSKGLFMVGGPCEWLVWFVRSLVWFGRFMVCSRLSRFAAWIGVAWFAYGSNRIGRGV